MPAYVVALDPSFRNTGYAVIELGEKGPVLRSVGVIVTKKIDKKVKMYAGDDNHRCAQLIATQLGEVLDVWKPFLVVAEAQAGSKNSRAAQLMGMGWGVVSAVTAARRTPVIQAQPQSVKLATTGVKTATKLAVQTAVQLRFPAVVPLLADVRPPSLHEHVYDALGVFIACESSTEIQSIRGIMENDMSQQIPICDKCKRSVLKCKCKDNNLDK
jgi:Holliday junction resolvasome RuvABC endonuclease subunit